jgi:hypothetical protein
MWSSLRRMTEIASRGSAAQSLTSTSLRPRLRRRRRRLEEEEVGGGGIGGRAWASGGLGFTRSRRSAGWSRRAKAAGGGSRGNATGPPRARPPPHPGRWGRACGRRPRAEAAATRLPERDPSRARPPPDAAGSAAEACCDGERRRRTASLPLPVGVWGREM